MRHVLDYSDVSGAVWETLYTRFEDILAHPDDYRDTARGHVLGTLFFEPSTRTCFSFQAAMGHLGGTFFGFQDPGATSAAKGESFADTVRMCSGYADTLVIRHPLEGAAKAASLYSRVPVINAGDGGHLHPTQTLTDLCAIRKRFGRIDGLRIALCGDLLRGRTAHSLIRALAGFRDVSLILVPALSLPDYMTEFIRNANMRCELCDSLSEAVSKADALYMTRIQRERLDAGDAARADSRTGRYTLTPELLSHAPRDLVILHPLPRREELPPELDADDRIYCFEQARLGVFIRMALLCELINAPKEVPKAFPPPERRECHNPACISGAERYLPNLRESGDSCAYCSKALGG